MSAAPGASMNGQALRAITGFHLVTQNLPRLVAFYRDVLGFAVMGPARPIEAPEMALLAVPGAAMRQTLSIGEQRVLIEQFDVAGRPYPAQSDVVSLWFQHLALVVPDIASAHARLRNATPISRHGPQHLPPASGGAKAFKFRDPDGHPLELLEFPAHQRPAGWQARAALPGQIVLGIDHTAISIGDLAASLRFYERLGLTAEPATLNHGVAQQNLDDLRDVRVSVAPMRPYIATPHLELLGYLLPRGDPGPAPRANDVAATRIGWHGPRPELLADPDGHFQQVMR
jgi:catechol 2,3-dioxygenase-like lactoylglutathione lyase family enzyme